jgi:hypothetical protein
MVCQRTGTPKRCSARGPRAPLEAAHPSVFPALAPQELGAMLQDLAGGQAPTEEELSFVLAVADAVDNKIDGEVRVWS